MKTILITRPVTHEFIQKFQTAGYELQALPTFVIEACPPSVVDSISYDAFVFFSPHAVAHAPTAIQKIAGDCPVFAVGASTAEALKKAGFSNINYPLSSANSENLLKLEQLQNIKNRRILLIQGAEGRDLVFHTLKERGAQVERCIVYQRRSLTLDFTQLQSMLETPSLAALIITSQTSLDDLHRAVASTPLHYLLQQIPLIVLSERSKIAAAAKGHHIVLIAHSLEFSDLIHTVNQP